jgi:hypothetical protein
MSEPSPEIIYPSSISVGDIIGPYEVKGFVKVFGGGSKRSYALCRRLFAHVRFGVVALNEGWLPVADMPEVGFRLIKVPS